MAQAGPYRVRVNGPESVDGFWRQIRRHRNWRRRLPWIIAFLTLGPALAVIVSGSRTTLRWLPGWYGGRGVPELGAPAVGHASDGLAKPWGFQVFTHVVPWSGVLPASAPRPSIDDSPISAEGIQLAVSAHGSELRECYLRSDAYESGWGGVLIASILIRRDGQVDVVVGGDQELGRVGVTACVQRTLKRLSFRAPDPKFGWVHMPLFFGLAPGFHPMQE